MKKIINYSLLFLKYLLYLGAFAISLYIITIINQKQNRNITELITSILPYILLLIVFFINIILRQKNINHNIFYNLTCCIVFLTTIIVGLRSIYDTNMILNQITGYNINFIYFNDYLVYMKILVYGLIVSNLCFMFKNKKLDVKKETEVL